MFGYPPGNPFGDSVAHLLEDLVTVTPSSNREYYDYYTSSGYLTSAASGHALCNTLLENLDCVICLVASKGRVLNDCREKIGVKCMLRDCMISYENYQFSD
ncbi:Leucyl-tRNA synthetase [Psidium guajava]|nr:Leucyl-tRNA synthetase [Psidium guajava]